MTGLVACRAHKTKPKTLCGNKLLNSRQRPLYLAVYKPRPSAAV